MAESAGPGELNVSGGTSVSTEDLEYAADQLGQLSGRLAELATELGRLELPSVPGVFYADQARVDADLARDRLHDLAGEARLLQGLLLTVGRGYEITERLVMLAGRGVESAAAHWVGARLAPLLLLSGAAGLAATVWSGLALSGAWLPGSVGTVANALIDGPGSPKGKTFPRAVNSFLTNAATVSLLRGVVQSIGPTMIAATGLPPSVTRYLGTHAYEVGARGIILPAQGLGMLRETGVALAERIPQPVTRAPMDYADRLSRIPHGERDAGPQVVIEKYTAPGEPDRYEVYVGGTVTFSPASDEPWDFTSNMFNAAGWESGSVESVRAAMADAGIDAGSPVQFTGYSQGGGTAAQLAASGDFNTQGIATFGGPTGQIELPEGVPAVIVEHTDDLVPALGGEQDNSGAVLVRRTAFEGEPLPDIAVPAHRFDAYLRTANLMDESHSPQLDETMARLSSFTAGATLESSTGYRFDRTDRFD